MAQFDSSITAYFGGDASGLNKVIDETQQRTARLADKVGDKIFGLRDVSHAVATALGLNIANIADHVARFVTGVSKDTEEALKASADISEKATDQAIKNMRAQLTEEQKYTLLLQDRDRLLAKMRETTGSDAQSQKAYQQARLDAEMKTAEIIAYNLKLEAQRRAEIEADLKARAIASEKEVSAYNERLTGEQKIAAIKDEIIVKEKAINAGLFTGKTLEEQKNFLAARQAELLGAENELIKANKAAERKRYDDRESAVKAYSQMLFDQKSTEEQLLILQKEAEDIQREMRALGKNSTEYMQDAVELGDIQNQIKEKTVSLINEQAAAEAKVTAEIGNQVKQTKIRYAFGMQGISNVSTDVLQAEKKALQNQIDKYTQQFPGRDPKVDQSYIYSQISSVDEELKFRSDFESSFKRGGRQGALQQYTAEGRNPLGFDTAIANMDSWSKGLDVSNQTLQSIDTTLKNVFKK